MTAIQLVAATLAQETRGQSSESTEAAVISFMNRISGGRNWGQNSSDATSQPGLQNHDMLKMISAPGQYEALTGDAKHSNRSMIQKMATGGNFPADLNYQVALDKLGSYSKYPLSGFRQIWRNNELKYDLGSREEFRGKIKLKDGTLGFEKLRSTAVVIGNTQYF